MKSKHGATMGKKFTSTYQTWRSMRSRCKAKSGSHHGKHYVDKGITLCKSWDDYSIFLQDMGERPDGCSIDRIDNSKGYCKENCRWATKSQQTRNYSRNRMITHSGVTQCLKDWADQYQMPSSRLFARLKLGWSMDRALTERSRHNGKKSIN
jgi:hypothetical protein